ncbi:MAG: CRISPR-associated protein Cas5 [bacterium]|nr:CRISPR-associated protein Cas5 [bacterium]
MTQQIESILSFKLSGKFAHFKKFYTNSSSLSYIVPPRTVITGLLGSILELPRDSYYDIFAEEKCKVSVSVSPAAVIKKITQSINMLHADYHKLLTKGTGKVMPSQCKLELLVSAPGRFIEYDIYVAMPPGNRHFHQLQERIQKGVPGFGTYLGQRQFRGHLQFTALHNPPDFQLVENAPFLDSICLQENVTSFNDDNTAHVISEQMPLQMKKIPPQKKKIQGREPLSVKRVLFERYGKRIHGNFKNCCNIGNKTISFY